MRFRADLHIHTDYDPVSDRRHGDRPERMAEAIVNGGIDVAGIVEHNKISSRYFDVKDEVDRLLSGTSRNISVLLGVEMTLSFEGRRYHVGHIFEGNFSRANLPEAPTYPLSVRDIEDFQRAQQGISILFHPAKNDASGAHLAVTDTLLRSGLVDGAEVLNGSMLANGADINIARKTLGLFFAARNQGVLLAPIGTSDAHRAELVGSAVTEFATASPENIFDIVRNQGNTRAIPIASKVRQRIDRLLGENPQMRKYILT